MGGGYRRGEPGARNGEVRDIRLRPLQRRVRLDSSAESIVPCVLRYQIYFPTSG